MYEISEANAVTYLQKAGHLPADSTAQVKALAWGVSNVVLRIHPISGPDFVIKQSREKLRTQADWFSRLDRIWREMDVMKALAPLLPQETIPRILFQDRENYLFGIEAVDAGHVVWKEELLAGRADPTIASKLGNYLATIHGATTGDAGLQQLLGDRQVFDELRIDPFYRRIAEVHAPLREPISSLINETFATSLCVVHADFSPKNVLLTEPLPKKSPHSGPRIISLVDFETGHFGDPAFDLGFFLSHLLLKTVKHAGQHNRFLHLAEMFWREYQRSLEAIAQPRPPKSALRPTAELERRSIAHLAGCLLSRIDGKSTIDYLPRPEQQDLVRSVSCELFLHPPARLADVFQRFGKILAATP